MIGYIVYLKPEDRNSTKDSFNMNKVKQLDNRHSRQQFSMYPMLKILTTANTPTMWIIEPMSITLAARKK